MIGRVPRPLIVGNWKMNGLSGSLSQVRSIVGSMQETRLACTGLACDVMICPPATLLFLMKDVVKGTELQLGGQDCHAAPHGAHTGGISAQMLKDAGALAVLVGHSERRACHGENNDDIRAKAAAAHEADLISIICIGETLKERESSRTTRVVGDQLAGSLPATSNASNTIIAYEPVWAIGSGLTPSGRDIMEVHGYLRKRLTDLIGADQSKAMRLLYGGSINSENAAELLSVADVDGALVGAASLSAGDFWKILRTFACD